MGNSTDSYDEIIASGMLDDPIPVGESGETVEMVVMELKEAVVGRYVHFECTSWYGKACALQYIGVVQG